MNEENIIERIKIAWSVTPIFLFPSNPYLTNKGKLNGYFGMLGLWYWAISGKHL